MSDTPQGHGWWQATDGRWYPPEAHPNFRAASPPQAPPPQQYAPGVPTPAGSWAPAGVSGQPGKKPWWRRWWAIGLWVFLGLIVVSAVASNPGEDEGEESAATTVGAGATTAPASTVATTAPADETAPATEAQPATTQAAPTTAPAPATTESRLTPSQQNAIRAAENYLSFKAFSRQGLIDQLSSEYGDQYPVEDATFAVDSLNVDWNEQAVKAAQSYLDFKAFSCQGLIDQLSSEYGDKYTVEQATFGAQAAGIC